MNKPITSADLVTPKVTTGSLPASRKVYARPDAAPELRVPVREITLEAATGEPPLPVYDTTGVYSDPDVAIDVEKGLAAHPHRMGQGARRRRAIRRPADPAGRQRQRHRKTSCAQFPQHAEAVAGARRQASHPIRVGEAPASSPRK